MRCCAPSWRSRSSVAGARVAQLDDPNARRAQIRELRQHLGLEPLVLDRQTRRPADLLLQARAIDGRGVVDDDRDRPALPHDRRQRAALPGHGRAPSASRCVDESLRTRKPVDDIERGITQDAGQRLAQLPRGRRLAELVREPGNRGACAPRPDDLAGQAEGERDQRERAREEDRRERRPCRTLERAFAATRRHTRPPRRRRARRAVAATTARAAPFRSRCAIASTRWRRAAVRCRAPRSASPFRAPVPHPGRRARGTRSRGSSASSRRPGTDHGTVRARRSRSRSGRTRR